MTMPLLVIGPAQGSWPESSPSWGQGYVWGTQASLQFLSSSLSMHLSLSLSLSSLFFFLTMYYCVCMSLSFQGTEDRIVCLSPGPHRCLPAGLSQDMISLIPACLGHLLFLSPYLGRAAFSSLLNHGCSFHDPNKFGAHDTN